MKALLIIAHGSRREQANNEIQQLTEYLEENDQSDFAWVRHSFLEMGHPNIPGSINELIQNGAREIVVLPYFLAAGAHVAKDIPEIIANLQQENPDVLLSIMPHIGSTNGMKRLLLMQIQQASFRKP
ncbi:MAG: cobalamin biosynthesis protein CbiX [Gammaproteobacteria bacterium]|nr:cobalamin biosynthesis protein CbiX [Gammaproteobacteria bacterium]